MNLWDSIKIINHGYRKRSYKLKVQKTFLINLAKDFPNKAIRWPLDMGCIRTLNRAQKRTSTWHLTVKTTRIQNKYRISEAARQKHKVIHKSNQSEKRKFLNINSKNQEGMGQYISLKDNYLQQFEKFSPLFSWREHGMHGARTVAEKFTP